MDVQDFFHLVVTILNFEKKTVSCLKKKGNRQLNNKNRKHFGELIKWLMISRLVSIDPHDPKTNFDA